MVTGWSSFGDQTYKARSPSWWTLRSHNLSHNLLYTPDVGDAEWICQLVEHGLVRPSFVPPKPIRELRNLTRYRKAQIEERGREAQRLDKVLQDAGVKLSSVATDIQGKSARAMLEALVGGGERDPQVLAQLALRKMRSKIPQLEEALVGRFGAHHALLVRTILAKVDFLDQAIEELSAEIDRVIAPFGAEVELLSTVTGVDRRAAEGIIAEIGIDMSRFPTAGHLASWAGMCPGNNESAGKHRSSRTRHGSKWLRIALVEAGQAAGRSKDTYLSAHYHRIRGRRGPGRAAVAVGHSILVIAWHLLSTGDLHRPGGRLLRQATDQHRAPTPPRRPTRSHGPSRHPRTRSLTKTRTSGLPRPSTCRRARTPNPEVIHTSDGSTR